jgi:hypothetical protein
MGNENVVKISSQQTPTTTQRRTMPLGLMTAQHTRSLVAGGMQLITTYYTLQNKTIPSFALGSFMINTCA